MADDRKKPETPPGQTNKPEKDAAYEARVVAVQAVAQGVPLDDSLDLVEQAEVVAQYLLTGAVPSDEDELNDEAV
jgi:hypothetical protein